MIEKYIDLETRVKSEVEASIIGEAYVRATLAWLDEHPDQVPGRTITASEFDEAVESCVTEDATVPPHTFAARLGVVCVPDPEPTNAEKLASHVLRITDDLYIGLPKIEINKIAKSLDEAGVKAPGGDE